MRTLISLLVLLFLAACSSSGPSAPPAADATPTGAVSATEATTPALSIEEFLAAMPDEPLPPDPESLTRAQRDGQSVAAKRSAPAEAAPTRPAREEAAPVPHAEPETPAAALPAKTAPAAAATTARPVVSPAATSSAPAQTTPTATSSDLSVESASVAKQVVDRQPSGQGPFVDGGTVWTWNRIINPGGKKRSIRHIYYREGKQVVVVPLAIGGASWRTWSHTRIQGTGQWRVDIVDEQSVVLKSLAFVVK